MVGPSLLLFEDVSLEHVALLFGHSLTSRRPCFVSDRRFFSGREDVVAELTARLAPGSLLA